MPTRVLLVDDDPLSRLAIADILSHDADVDVVGQVDGGAAALDWVRSHPFVDVVLMDLQMPGVNGVEATRQLKTLPGAPEVLVFTTWDGDDAVLRSLEAGATGFLLKTSQPQEITAAIQAVARGDAVLSPSSARRVVQELTRGVDREQRKRARSRVDRLSAREREVAVRVTHGLSNDDIARQLHISTGTVKQQIAAISGKLDVRGRVLIAVVLATAGLGPNL